MAHRPDINAGELSARQRMTEFRDFLRRVRAYPPDRQARWLAVLSTETLRFFRRNWLLRARSHQLPPDEDHLVWVLLGGRGSGKTRAGAEWVRDRVARGAKRIALVAPTLHEARSVMVEGESGLLNIGDPADKPVFYPSRRRLEWPGGAVAELFSAEDPDGLRGPQFDTAWADEFCAWARPSQTLSNLRLALRLPFEPDGPKLTVTSTPRPMAALEGLLKEPGVSLTRMRTDDNALNLAPGFIAAMRAAFGGTRLGRQELDGDILGDRPGALFTRTMMERVARPDADYARADFDRVILAVDPSVTSGPQSDACGIIVVGTQERLLRGRTVKTAVVLHDGTLNGQSPAEWAGHVAWLAGFYQADYVLAEVNQGGEMVRDVLHTADAGLVVRSVRAVKNKVARAVPVSLLYEQGRVSHAGRFSELEDELCALGTDETSHSPDRADALIHALTELMLDRRLLPRIRALFT